MTFQKEFDAVRIGNGQEPAADGKEEKPGCVENTAFAEVPTCLPQEKTLLVTGDQSCAACGKGQTGGFPGIQPTPEVRVERQRPGVAQDLHLDPAGVEGVVELKSLRGTGDLPDDLLGNPEIEIKPVEDVEASGDGEVDEDICVCENSAPLVHRLVEPFRKENLPGSIVRAALVQESVELFPGNLHEARQLSELASGDLLASERFEGKAQEAGPKLVPSGDVIGLGQAQQPGKTATPTLILLGQQRGRFVLGEKMKIAEAVEGGGPADSKMIGKQHDIVELDLLRAGFGPNFRWNDSGPVEDIQPRPSRLPLPQLREKRASSFLRHQEASGERVGTNLRHRLPFGQAAQGSPKAPIQNDMGELVDPGKPAAEEVMPTVRNHQQAEARVHQRQSRDVIRKVDQRGPDPLIFQQADDIADRAVTETESTAFIGCRSSSLFDRLPAGAGSGGTVAGHSRLGAAQAQAFLKVRDLSGQDRTTTDSHHDLLLGRRCGSEEGDDRLLGLKVLCEKVSNISSKQAREAVQLQAGDRPVPRLKLRNRRAGKPQMTGHLFLSQPLCLAGLAEPLGEIVLRDCHKPMIENRARRVNHRRFGEDIREQCYSASTVN